MVFYNQCKHIELHSCYRLKSQDYWNLRKKLEKDWDLKDVSMVCEDDRSDITHKIMLYSSSLFFWTIWSEYHLGQPKRNTMTGSNNDEGCKICCLYILVHLTFLAFSFLFLELFRYLDMLKFHQYLRSLQLLVLLQVTSWNILVFKFVSVMSWNHERWFTNS